MNAFKSKHQRLILIVVSLTALMMAGLIAAYALRNQASYFYVPSQFVSEPPEIGRAVRLGGMVREGSLERLPDGVSVGFIVSDGDAQVPVRFTGIVPDLFVEGSGVVAEGRLGPQGTFLADNLLAKHDENYVPRELEEMTARQKREVVAETEAAAGRAVTR
ncbi:cytochrome c maturation protein CcmE [Pseudopontixanthobacter vadosimaris]|uniref:cytochrome c maturation protein CcmE n=1 Tax=Pseudopontixanthobacter vadosimaris TaxID=2726450 RepID=UPI0014755ADD|nr:cytochrome c maturation protein CcmE [Pseudopontixanthobacter vadosimaris]